VFFFLPPSNFYPQSYFSSNFCPQSCSHSRLFPVPFSRETQERARRSARGTGARERLRASDPETQRHFCRQTIPSTCSDLQFAIFALRNDSFFRTLCKMDQQLSPSFSLMQLLLLHSEIFG
jgi:hypothetical protein